MLTRLMILYFLHRVELGDEESSNEYHLSNKSASQMDRVREHRSPY